MILVKICREEEKLFETVIDITSNFNPFMLSEREDA